LTYRNQISSNVSKSYKRFFAEKNDISGTIGCAVTKILRYFRAMLMVIQTKFGEEISNSLKDIANYEKFKMADSNMKERMLFYFFEGYH